MRQIGKGIKKIDSSAIVEGKALYTLDLTDRKALIVKVLRSPHASAKIIAIDKSRALSVPGIVGIYTYEDVPQHRFTLAGQSYPEPSPYDRLILENRVRFVGDSVAIIAAKTKKAAQKAMRMIKVEYEVLEPLLDPKKSLDHEILVHDEEDIHFNLPQEVQKYNAKRNLLGQIDEHFGEDVDEVLASLPHVVEGAYETQAAQQCMMETFRSYSYLDMQGRLVVISSTQVPFHIKRQLARALQISTSRIRVIKPRVGGGFGAKQTSVTEIYCAFVTLKTGLPALCMYDRKESFASGNTRHAMSMRVKMGADEEGLIRAIKIDALSDQGAYGEHCWTTLGLVGEKTLPLYNKTKASAFHGKVVYTNKELAGAYRGYGATQGCFAVESLVDDLASVLQLDPVEFRQRNIVKEGEKTASYGKRILSCKLEECIIKGKEMIGWDEKFPCKDMGDGRIRSVGMAITMQGSGIAHIDMSTVNIKLNEGGDYTLFMSPTDVGTGADTILLQMAAEELNTDMDHIITVIADTDLTPYDPGSYASSGTYVTGNAVIHACRDIKHKILEKAAALRDVPVENLELHNEEIIDKVSGEKIELRMISEALSAGPEGETLFGFGSFGSKTSPPPFMAGFVEIELNTWTGKVDLIDFVAVVDCGTIINENLATVQVEGGIAQGIGYALYEDVKFSEKGKLMSNSFMQYKIPTRQDVGTIRVAFEKSFEPSGPFGAKSIGEIVINTPAPAIGNAIFHATGKRFTSLPITPEDVLLALHEG